MPEVLNTAKPGNVPQDVPLLMVPGLAPIIPRARYIMSCRFFQPHEVRFMHSGRRSFYMKRAKRGEFQYVVVYDSQQECLNTSDPYIPPNQAGTIMLPVRVETIIEDLINHWGWISVGQMTRMQLGVIAISGSQGTDDEKKLCQAREDRAAQRIVEHADMVHVGSMKGEITEIHRQALEYLGSERKPWYRLVEPGMTKLSAATGNRIPQNALTDAGIDLIELYVKHDLDPLDYEDLWVAERPELLSRARKRMGIELASAPIPPAATHAKPPEKPEQFKPKV